MKISAQVIEVLEYLGEKFGIAIDWTQENIMPYAEQLLGKYVQWEIATSWMWIIVFGVLAVIGVIVIVADFASWDTVIASEFGFSLSIAGIVAIVYHVHTIITCYYFPEMQIIEYISQIMQRT